MSLAAAVSALLLAAPVAASVAPRARCTVASRTWLELRTAHFVLSTDLDEEDAEDVAQQLEVLRGAVAGALEVPEDVGGTLRVLAFARGSDWRAFAPPDLSGYFGVSGDGSASVAVNASGHRLEAAAIVAHELTHHLLAHLYPRQPRWFAEGLAAYLEAAGEGTPGETIRIGQPPPHRLDEARRDPVPVAELLAATGRLTSRQYAASWLLVHYLLAKHRPRFVAFERRLARAEEPAAAWLAEFPEWDPSNTKAMARLDRELARYLDGGEYVETRFTGRGEGAFRIAKLGAAEVHALRIAARRPADEAARASLRTEIDEALEEEPTNVAALWARAGEPEARLEPTRARAAAAQHPGDPRAWALVAVAARNPEERLAALRRGLAVAGDDAASLGVLAELLRLGGKLDEAWPVATRAARLAPWSSRILGTCADLALALDRCGEARAYAARALEVLPDSAPPGSPTRTRAEERARAATAWCAAPSPAPRAP